MTCPRCEKQFDILAFQRMEDSEKYAHELAPIFKCPRQFDGCGFFFAPSDHAVVQNLNPKGVPEDIRYE
jgi:hypothetical protein